MALSFCFLERRMYMREIICRGKRTYNGEWVEGSLVHIGDFCAIVEHDQDRLHHLDQMYLDETTGMMDGYATKVPLETVGQWTGLFDKNEKKIFEGDIVKTEYGRLCTVVWFSNQVYNGWDLMVVNTCENILHTKPPSRVGIYKKDNLEVVGNIHDNPELLR